MDQLLVNRVNYEAKFFRQATKVLFYFSLGSSQNSFCLYKMVESNNYKTPKINIGTIKKIKKC